MADQPCRSSWNVPTVIIGNIYSSGCCNSWTVRYTNDMTTTTTLITQELLSVCPSPRPQASGWVAGRITLDTPPAPGMKVQIVSASGSGHTYGTGTVVESPRVTNASHPMGRLREWQKSFRVVSDWTEERYGKQVPMMRFDVEYRLTDPIKEHHLYDLTREQLYDLLPEWAQAKCVRSLG